MLFNERNAQFSFRGKKGKSNRRVTEKLQDMNDNKIYRNTPGLWDRDSLGSMADRCKVSFSELVTSYCNKNDENQAIKRKQGKLRKQPKPANFSFSFLLQFLTLDPDVLN